VAHSYVDRFNLTPGAFEVVHNPVDLDRVQRLANQDPDDPWFSQGAPPVVLGVGRLEPQKGFDTLLRAVSILQRRLPARLLILGEGPERPSLEKLAGDLGMREATRLPGFVTNPWSYMARAAVFCLSSRFEGFGLVVAEAMAVGLGVVATDCGPTSELLDGGRLGPLVPVDDHEALAVALEQTIRQPPPRHLLLAKAASFDVSQVADRYASLLGLVAEARSGGSLPGSSAATGNQP
jgi:glycosyltransferase involved in cell wall biosynthesis